MYFYKMVLQYKGTNYFGWQEQKTGEPTVEGHLRSSLKKVCKSDEVATLGAGRTDAGVHALGQTCKIQIPIKIDSTGLRMGVNSFLPNDIRVISCEESEESFHPIYDSKSKEYRYLFSNQKDKDVFTYDAMMNISYHLNFDLMSQACDIFVGKHDFVNYFTLGSNTKDSVREILQCRLEKTHYLRPGDLQEIETWQFVFVGTGFLKQMVRLIVGAIWNVGSEKVRLSEIEESLKGKKLAKKLGFVAPARGLYQIKNNY